MRKFVVRFKDIIEKHIMQIMLEFFSNKFRIMNEMEKLNQKIVDFIQYLGIPLRTFEREIGVANGSISKPIKHKSNFSQKIVDKIIIRYPEFETWINSVEKKANKSEIILDNKNFVDELIQQLQKENESLRKDKEFLQQMLAK